MKIVSYSDIGHRENNEDSIAVGEFVFVLCDGVGGAAKGEVASQFVAKAIINKTNGISQSSVTESLVQNLINEVQNELNSYAATHPKCQRMGTTLAAVFVSENNFIVAHIGDSRIYFIDPQNKKYWRSRDHSVVSELINSGLLDEKEVKDHYLKNQITRAIQAIPDVGVVNADITSINKAVAGDLFFLCSDGVNEVLDDSELVSILSNTQMSIQSRLDVIQKKCQYLSSDNNSAILIEVEPEDEACSAGECNLVWNNLPSSDLIFKEDKSMNTTAKPNLITNSPLKRGNDLNKLLKIALYTFAVLFIALITLSILKHR